MSNRLTFSLASLILLIALRALCAESVNLVVLMAHEPGLCPGDKVQATVTFSGAMDVTTTATGPHLISLLDDDDPGVGNLIHASTDPCTATVGRFSSSPDRTTMDTEVVTDGLGIHCEYSGE